MFSEDAFKSIGGHIQTALLKGVEAPCLENWRPRMFPPRENPTA